MLHDLWSLSRSIFIGWNEIQIFEATWYGSPLLLAAKAADCCEYSSLQTYFPEVLPLRMCSSCVNENCMLSPTLRDHNLKQVGTCAIEPFVVGCQVSCHSCRPNHLAPPNGRAKRSVNGGKRVTVIGSSSSLFLRWPRLEPQTSLWLVFRPDLNRPLA